MAFNNKTSIIKTFLSIALLLSANNVLADCTLKMVFKDGDKAPLMNASPDNSGIFEDVFNEAASRINCKLTITRLPKERLHRGLKRGEYDFYPGASFSNKRASYLSYIDNGLETGEYGISSQQLPTLKTWKELAKYPEVIWLMESNSSKNELADIYNIKKQTVNYLNIEKVIEFIKTRPQFLYFYVADKELLDNYLSKHQYQGIEENNLRLHANCCGQLQPMYLAFARRSKKFSSTLNLRYQSQQKLTAENQPTQAEKSSIAYQLSQALKAMQKEGITEQIIQHWYPNL